MSRGGPATWGRGLSRKNLREGSSFAAPHRLRPTRRIGICFVLSAHGLRYVIDDRPSGARSRRATILLSCGARDLGGDHGIDIQPATTAANQFSRPRKTMKAAGTPQGRRSTRAGTLLSFSRRVSISRCKPSTSNVSSAVSRKDIFVEETLKRQGR